MVIKMLWSIKLTTIALMGSSISTEEVVHNATVIINELRARVSIVEASVSALEKSFMNFQVSQRENNDLLRSLEDYVFSLRLLEEGRSSYSKNKKFHTRSSYIG